jgi:hypothetical protein
LPGLYQGRYEPHWKWNLSATFGLLSWWSHVRATAPEGLPPQFRTRSRVPLGGSCSDMASDAVSDDELDVRGLPTGPAANEAHVLPPPPGGLPLRGAGGVGSLFQ